MVGEQPDHRTTEWRLTQVEKRADDFEERLRAITKLLGRIVGGILGGQFVLGCVWVLASKLIP